MENLKKKKTWIFLAVIILLSGFIGAQMGGQDSFASGYESGYADGYSDGVETGTTDGYELGYDEGADSGYDDGYAQGLEIGNDVSDTDASTQVYDEDEATLETVYVTRTGECYHEEGCSYLNQDPNPTAMSVEEAEAAGYRPCSRCIGN